MAYGIQPGRYHRGMAASRAFRPRRFSPDPRHPHRRRARRWLRIIFVLLLLAFLVYCWNFLPIISGHAAKTIASGVFVSGRKAEQVQKADLGFPFSWVSYRLDSADNSVSTSFWGLARRKAVYRKGLGVTLLSGITEAELRQQHPRLATAPPFGQDTVDWPAGGRIRDTVPPGIDRQQLERVIHAAFYDDLHKEERGTRALLIVYRDQIIAERYAAGFSADMPLLGWSMAKSLLNAELGIMVRQGLLDTAAQAPVAAWQNDDRRNIHIADLMNMTSGLRFIRFMAGPGDIMNMLFREKDMSTYAAGFRLRHPPGTKWSYSDGNANILSGIVRQRLGDSLYYRYPYEQLFHKIGMFHTVLEPDGTGNFVASSYAYATARDWARFGLLYLHDGVWQGQRILPEGWVSWSTAHSRAAWIYGALWWTDKEWFYADGFDGQYVYVCPSKDLVVVRLSLEKRYWEPGELMKEAVKIVP